MIRSLEKNEISHGFFRKFILKRDQSGRLDMDSSGHNYYYLDILAREFPDAKFIYVVRDCYSWLDSLVNQMRLPDAECDSPGNFDFGLFKRICDNDEALLQDLHKYIDIPLAFWSHTAKLTLKQLPVGRSLIISTNEISKRIHDMARFIGVPVDTLNTTNIYTHGARTKFDILNKVDYDILRCKFDKHCADIMEKLFPGYTLNDFLNGRKPQLNTGIKV